MCLVLYVGAEQSLDAAEEGLEFLKVEGNRPVRRRLQTSQLYEIRTKEGCACGFIADEYPPDPEVEQNRVKLHAMVRDLALEAGGRVDLFACWISDERRPLTDKTIEVGELADETFAETMGRPLLLRVRSS